MLLNNRALLIIGIYVVVLAVAIVANGYGW
jgi:hypothetical protein